MPQPQHASPGRRPWRAIRFSPSPEHYGYSSPMVSTLLLHRRNIFLAVSAAILLGFPLVAVADPGGRSIGLVMLCMGCLVLPVLGIASWMYLRAKHLADSMPVGIFGQAVEWHFLEDGLVLVERGGRHALDWSGVRQATWSPASLRLAWRNPVPGWGIIDVVVPLDSLSMEDLREFHHFMTYRLVTQCPRCRYDLRGQLRARESRCPECGAVFWSGPVPLPHEDERATPTISSAPRLDP